MWILASALNIPGRLNARAYHMDISPGPAQAGDRQPTAARTKNVQGVDHMLSAHEPPQDRNWDTHRPYAMCLGCTTDSSRFCLGKVVALIDGVALSVYDGVTQYMPGTTWFQEAQANHDAGIYVYPSYEHCLKRDAESFPTDSVLLNAPRAIAAVLCW